MITTLQLLREPLFWLASVIFSIVIGVVGNLLTPIVADFFRQHSNFRSERDRVERFALFGEVIVIFDKGELLIQAKLDAIYAFVVSIFMLLGGMVFLVVSLLLQSFVITPFVWVFVCFSIPMVWLGLFAASAGHRRITIVRLAESRKRDAFSFASAKKLALDSPEVFKFYEEWDRKSFGGNIDELKEHVEKRLSEKTCNTSYK